ncbi:TetR/AcrR family transcriptional regulator [Sinimarinibacterium sp. CAU 1509]|uniref:TetR/AcrR family transcriptional regulator n=1 Tax=Sinimarinibacterium sp. CAU 1509 TaxID=2562283 RepID=UPI0010ABF1F1|nr:TetR/AcrR family transcriptional regulator [Sinimarinibacterium sp. CAU 1509]TJY65062.1 TetR/AcrR family transcriptional regulator [Sinimarinibacterium sp. CAU 1509]
MGRRNQHSREQQREMAIAAAELILVREGFAGLSMRKVADAIGYTVGSLYLIFQNQDDLLATINERTTDAIYGHLRDAIEWQSEPLPRLQQLGAAYIEFAQTHPARFRMLFEHRLPPEMEPRTSSETRIRRMFELVESCVAPLMSAASPQQLRRAATTLWSGVHGIASLAISGKFKWAGDAEFRGYCDDLIGTYVAGLQQR